ncbi:helix-turn-helix domain-containing protein [Alcanivoracaceae bacterium MT1]
MNLGKIIYYHRKKQKMTQEDLCRGICSASHLSKIENNSKDVNEETLTLLCNRLGISIEKEGNFSRSIQA